MTKLTNFVPSKSKIPFINLAHQSKTDSLHAVDDRSMTPTSPLLNVGNTRLQNYTPVSIDESSIEGMGSARKNADGQKRVRNNAYPSRASLFQPSPKSPARQKITQIEVSALSVTKPAQ